MVLRDGTPCNREVTDTPHSISSHMSDFHRDGAYQRGMAPGTYECWEESCDHESPTYFAIEQHIRRKHGFRGSSKPLRLHYDFFPSTTRARGQPANSGGAKGKTLQEDGTNGSMGEHHEGGVSTNPAYTPDANGPHIDNSSANHGQDSIVVHASHTHHDAGPSIDGRLTGLASPAIDRGSAGRGYGNVFVDSAYSCPGSGQLVHGPLVHGPPVHGPPVYGDSANLGEGCLSDVAQGDNKYDGKHVGDGFVDFIDPVLRSLDDDHSRSGGP
ncbi:hypothetical protein GGS21DRAFT_307014 [Xylaria nigripes]|nr:hypothetical protein GGS21DRAFT_307014 [Xylaria nigripes]